MPGWFSTLGKSKNTRQNTFSFFFAMPSHIHHPLNNKLLGSNTPTSMFHTLPTMITTSSRVPSTQLIVHMTNGTHGEPLTSFTTKLEVLTLLITLIPLFHITKHRLRLMPLKKTFLKFIFTIRHPSLKRYGEFARDVLLLRRGEIITFGITVM